MSTTDLEIAIQNIWHEIEKWYLENAPGQLEDLKAGVSAQDISNFESHVGLALPDDYKASLKLHNGNISIRSYSYLRLEEVLSNWLSLTTKSRNGAFENGEVFDAGEGIIQNTWWHKGWIPFAKDSGGNFICIDMTPASKGVVGQIIIMERLSGPVASEYKSFLEWLESYKNELYQEAYEVDKDGYLIEKFS